MLTFCLTPCRRLLPAMACILLCLYMFYLSLIHAAPLDDQYQRRALLNNSLLTTDNSKFTFYDIPGPLSGPCDLCTGPDGALWGQDQLLNQLFRIDPHSGDIETFEIPFALDPILNATLPDPLSSVAGRIALSCAIRPGRDGNVYSAFGTRNQLVRINPTTKHIDVFTPDNLLQPLGDLQPFNDLYSAQDGIYFTQTSANLISFFSFETETIESYAIPTPASFPLGMFVDSDGIVFFTELLGQKIGRFDPHTRTFTEYPVPLSLSGPAVIRVETENRYIWFTAFIGNGMGRLDKVTGEITATPNSLVGGFVAEDTIDGDGMIWYSTANQNTLSKLNTKTGEQSKVVIPGTSAVAPVSVPLYFVIAMNYWGTRNEVCFTMERVDQVGCYSLE